jgi:hypothetical protein
MAVNVVQHTNLCASYKINDMLKTLNIVSMLKLLKPVQKL